MIDLSPNQFNALHLYCERLAEALNDAGYEMKAVMEVKEIDVPWTKESVKEVLWKPLQKAMKGKDSTTRLSRSEVGEVYDILDRHIATNFGITVPFPSQEEK